MVERSEVIIVGGGPVGLLLGNLLAASQIPVIVLEKELKRPSGSKAIGITPISLGLLEKIQLAETFINQGLPVFEAHVFGSSYKLGQVRLDELPAPYNYILTLPQTQTERLLEENLKKYPRACLKRGREVYKIATRNNEGVVTANVRTKPGSGSGEQDETYAGRYICGCDGVHSTIRRLLKIPFRGKYYPDTFVMGNYNTTNGTDKNAYLYFTGRGSVESFPLPGNRRRWIAQTPCLLTQELASYLEQAVAIRTGVSLDPATCISASSFRPERFLASAFFHDNFILCGDAAHTMSPIGGQGMNTGFGDADWLASIILGLTRVYDSALVPGLLAEYEAMRKKAVGITANRVGTWMRIGTIKGQIRSGVRNFLLASLLHMPQAKKLPFLFAGHAVPCTHAGDKPPFKM